MSASGIQAAESDWDCCEDDESQQKTEESPDTDERGDSSPHWDCCEDGESQQKTDESRDTDERGDSSPELEDDDLETSGADVDRPEPILAPPDSDDLAGDEDVPLVDDDPYS